MKNPQSKDFIRYMLSKDFVSSLFYDELGVEYKSEWVKEYKQLSSELYLLINEVYDKPIVTKYKTKH